MADQKNSNSKVTIFFTFRFQKGDWNDWVWENSGISANFTNWNSGQPNGGTGHNCATMRYNRKNQWDDVSCTDYKSAKPICQILI